MKQDDQDDELFIILKKNFIILQNQDDKFLQGKLLKPIILVFENLSSYGPNLSSWCLETYHPMVETYHPGVPKPIILSSKHIILWWKHIILVPKQQNHWKFIASMKNMFEYMFLGHFLTRNTLLASKIN